MSFFEGSGNSAQWVALTLNILAIISYLIKYKYKPELKFNSMFCILFIIIIIILYYTAIDRNLKDWNIAYFVVSLYNYK